MACSIRSIIALECNVRYIHASRHNFSQSFTSILLWQQLQNSANLNKIILIILIKIDLKIQKKSKDCDKRLRLFAATGPRAILDSFSLDLFFFHTYIFWITLRTMIKSFTRFLMAFNEFWFKKYNTNLIYFCIFFLFMTKAFLFLT